MCRATMYKKCISHKPQAFQIIEVLADVPWMAALCLHYECSAATVLGLRLRRGSGMAGGAGDRQVKLCKDSKGKSEHIKYLK